VNARIVMAAVSAAGLVGWSLQASAASEPKFHIAVVPGGDVVSEPSITVDHGNPQRVYVSGPSGLVGGSGGLTTGHPGANNSPAWVSKNGGRTFQSIQPTSVGPFATRFGGGDTDIITDKANNVYATDLWLGDDSLSYSTDHGATWTGSPVSHRPADDRNWMAYSSKDDALYQVYDGFDGAWISRADGVSTNPAAALVATNHYPVFNWDTGASKGFNPPGRLTVDQRTGELYVVFAEGSVQLDVAHSTDKGQTWSHVTLPGSSSAFFLAQPAVDPAGNVAVAWAAHGKSFFSISGDGGRSFHTSQLTTSGQSTFTVIAALGRDHWAESWVEKTDLTKWRARYADIRHALSGRPSIKEATVDSLVFDKSANPESDRSMGDFISNTVTSDGAYLLTYTAYVGGKLQTRVARLDHAVRGL
jgi:hypothetical protein